MVLVVHVNILVIIVAQRRRGHGGWIHHCQWIGGAVVGTTSQQVSLQEGTQCTVPKWRRFRWSEKFRVIEKFHINRQTDSLQVVRGSSPLSVYDKYDENPGNVFE